MSSRDIAKLVGEAWGSHWDEIHNLSIKAGKKLLLVEGDDDKDVVEQLFEQVEPLWMTKVHVGVAGDRGKVLRKLEKHPDWYGLVDRDVWDEADVQQQTSALPGLKVTEAWCIESYFCEPGLLETALGLPAGSVQQPITPQVDGWLCYGAIWWTLQRWRESFAAALPSSDFGHPAKDACHPVQDEPTLRKRLDGCQASLHSIPTDQIVAAIQARLREIDALAVAGKLEKGIHGKRFFKEVIVPALNKADSQREADEWRRIVAGKWKARWPADLQAFARDLVR
ncbi:DUF4435 domain-containing protein [Chondromyces apiculatus]|uniref:Uncharacterized protein n=1 Tax=Chondromyces apiculatus DSM 436 TaxID=1192034 RepID=A0A017T040_9BACT|nr:DUF4435 domain-containing protein [Chondromyces apiculatus]EYF02594.1 Hypothetical protein CAP_6705 [Chondromyces apiculatus DSM 436]